MSDQTPPTEPTEPTLALGSEFQPEPAEAGHGSKRRGLLLAGVVAVVVLVLGGAAFAAWSFLNGTGPRPDEVLPASTVALATVDLDPKAGQKIEAIKTLRKFPALRDSLGIDSSDDLRRYLVDKGLGLCDGLDYETDVKPWIGERAAVAAVDLGGKYPTPALLLQVSDTAGAEKGVDDLIACARETDGLPPSDFGYVVGDDYLVISDSGVHAKAILEAGKKNNLADDATYQKWSGEVGDQGVLNFYVAPTAGKFLGEALDGLLGGLPGSVAEDFQSELGLQGGSEGEADADALGDVKDGLDEFAGVAGALRFADGGMELVVVGQNGGLEQSDPVGKAVAKLPSDTALVAGLSVPDDLVQQLLDRVEAQDIPGVQSFLDDAEIQTGLDLPDDLQTLLGNAIMLTVGGDAPSGLEDFDDPENVPVALVRHGDPDEALGIIGTVEEHLGLKLSDIPIVTETGDDVLVLSPSSAYAASLTESGKLGSSDLFQRAVPDAEKAQGLFFLALDTGWREAIVDLAGTDLDPQESDELAANLEPFGALGLSATIDGDVSRFQLRIATD